MKVQMSDAGVPFVISYKKILRKPKIKRQRKFVGPFRLVRNLVTQALEAALDVIEKAAFETEIEYLDRGQSVTVHWAVNIDDPFDARPGQEKTLMAFRMLDDMPPCGAHFEIISPPPSDAMEDLSPEAASLHSGPQTNLAHGLTAEQFDILRRRQQGEILEDVRVNGKFVRPPDSAYAPRPVRTIDDEAEAPTSTEDTEGFSQE